MCHVCFNCMNLWRRGRKTVWIWMLKFPLQGWKQKELLSRGFRVKMLSEDVERFLYLEQSTARFPLCSQKQTIHLPLGMRPCALCHCSGSIRSVWPRQEGGGTLIITCAKKIEQSGPTWADSEISDLVIWETGKERECFSDLRFHVTVFIITLPGKAAVGLHNTSQQTGETKAWLPGP